MRIVVLAELRNALQYNTIMVIGESTSSIFLEISLCIPAQLASLAVQRSYVVDIWGNLG